MSAITALLTGQQILYRAFERDLLGESQNGFCCCILR